MARAADLSLPEIRGRICDGCTSPGVADGYKLTCMDTVFGNDWTSRGTSELIAFFSWLDALCLEAQRQGLEPPLPLSERMTQTLNYWLVDFCCGLTPSQALDAYQSVNRSERAGFFHPPCTAHPPIALHS
jgi:hypothetical protein